MAKPRLPVDRVEYPVVMRVTAAARHAIADSGGLFIEAGRSYQASRPADSLKLHKQRKWVGEILEGVRTAAEGEVAVREREPEGRLEEVALKPGRLGEALLGQRTYGETPSTRLVGHDVGNVRSNIERLSLIHI